MSAAPSPRLHKNLVAAVVEALETSFGKGYYADKVIERLLKRNPKWGARDRHFIADSTYEIVRWWRWLWALADKEPSLKRKDLYHLFGLWWHLQGHPLPDWLAFAKINLKELTERRSRWAQDLAVSQSFPQWLHQRAQSELGDDWPAIAKALNLSAPVALRTNTLKTDREGLRQKLNDEGIAVENSSLSPLGLILQKRQNTAQSACFNKGLFEVQDTGSQLIAPFLGVAPGHSVIDACAGAGGKSLHLAALMENCGKLLAMDVEGRKLSELEKRAKRNGVSIIETATIKSTHVIDAQHQSADRLLLDVPCSGTGVIKRKVDSKWKLQPEHLLRVQKLQRNILKDYSQMLKVGGRMVYATCSILPSENEEQVAQFLSHSTQFRLLEEKRLPPGRENDGFYMALIERVA